MSSTKPHVPLAIVGVSALFPGSSDGTGFWRDILAGRDLISDVPATHWLTEDYYDPDPRAPDKTYCRRGGFLDNIAFDPLRFGVPPSIVPATDTSQLLGLIVAQRVLEDATGGDMSRANRDRTSVILGVTSGQELLASMVSRLQRPVWVKSLREAGVAESKVEEICDRIADHYVPWQESSFPGLLGNVVAGRIANRLDLGGTNCVTDAACASTFAALSMAAGELYLGESDMVITGGVDTLNDILMYTCFSKTPALSPTGDCRPFSDQADGTLLGEGLAMVALRRLADAERDGDRIYAVLRGVGASSDGRAKSVYAPRPEGQAKALERAYERAGYGPDTVELIEAHGTATKAGDVAEFGGLRLAFDASGRQDRQWCALGSVKSQIGHTKAAAGAGGLFKAVMALHHKVLPPTIKVERPNPELAIEQSAFYLNTRARPWVRKGDHPRRASVSSFGFGGSNFHLALEEYVGEAPRAVRRRTGATELVVLAADTPTALLAKLRATHGTLASLAQLSQQSWSGGAARVAIVANSDDDLADKLVQAAELIAASPDQSVSSPRGIHYGVGAIAGDVALLFPGQGSQYLDMGAELAMNFEQALAVWDEAAEAGLPLHDVVFPKPTFGDDSALRQQLTQTEWAQPAIGATSLALLRLLDAVGLEPSCVGGHSYGEVTALCAAGVVDAPSMLRIARTRGELMAAAATTPGAMLAVSASVDEVRKLVAAESGVVIANHNAPTQVVLSGPVEAIDRTEEALTRGGVSFKRLDVATAFHSSVVRGSCAPFRQALADISMSAATIPVYAGSLAAPYPAESDAIRDVLAAQIAEPVRFVEQIEAMYAAGMRVFVEVGPGSVLTSLVKRTLGDREHQAINTDRKGKHDVACFNEALARLIAAGAPLDFRPLWHGAPQPAAETAAPKMVLQLNGSNYGKPYPPVNGAAGLPPPNPEEVSVNETSRANGGANGAAASQHHEAHSGNGIATGNGESHRSNSSVAQQVSSVVAGTTQMVANPLGWVQVYQEMQRQTAEAHTAFQNAMAQAHIAFLRTAEQSTASLASMVTGVAVPTGHELNYTPHTFSAHQAPPTPMLATPIMTVPIPAPHVAAPPVATAPQVAASQVAAPQVAAPQVAAPQVAAPPVPTAPQVAAPPVAAPQVVAPAPTAAAPIAAAPPAAAAVSSVDAKALLLQVVADKTGYPAEMLSMDMALEADLGIDSIKRVEILAGIRTLRPDLPEVNTKEMATITTLGEIVTYMEASLGGSAAGAEESPRPKADSAATP